MPLFRWGRWGGGGGDIGNPVRVARVYPKGGKIGVGEGWQEWQAGPWEAGERKRHTAYDTLLEFHMWKGLYPLPIVLPSFLVSAACHRSQPRLNLHYQAIFVPFHSVSVVRAIFASHVNDYMGNWYGGHIHLRVFHPSPPHSPLSLFYPSFSLSL